MLFQVYGCYTPLDILLIARKSDPQAHFKKAEGRVYAPPQYADDFMDASRKTVIVYKGDDVVVTGSWAKNTYTNVIAPAGMKHAEELQRAAFDTLGGGLVHSDQTAFFKPLTPFPSSKERMAGLNALRDDPVYVAYQKSGLAPTNDILSKVVLEDRPFAQARSYVAPDKISLVQDTAKHLMMSGFNVVGDLESDSASLVISYKDQKASVVVEVNNPSCDYVMQDTVRRRPEVFDGLGILTLHTPQPNFQEMVLEQKVADAILDMPKTLPAARFLNQAIPAVAPLGMDNGTVFNEGTPFGSNIRLEQVDTVVMQSDAMSHTERPLGVEVVSREWLSGQDIPSHWRYNDMTDMPRLRADAAALAYVLAVSVPETVVLPPDLYGMSEFDAVVVNPGKDAVYLNIGGRFATPEQSREMSEIKRPSSLKAGYSPISMAGNAELGDRVRSILREAMLSVSLDDFKKDMEYQNAPKRGPHLSGPHL